MKALNRVIASTLKTVFIIGIICLLSINARAATIEVDAATDGTLAALDQAGDGVCSLREAIANANNDNTGQDDCTAGSGNDTITFNGVSSITLVDEISIISDIKIQGTVTISGNNATRIFKVSSSSGHLTLSDVTLQNGKSSGAGGAILQDTSSNLDCDASTFKNNKAEGVGGAISSSGTLNVQGCNFESNEAGNDGGAIYKDSGFTLTVTGSNFVTNKAGTDPQGSNQTDGGSGGAIYVTSSFTTITGSRFNKNTAASGNSINSGGGAINNATITAITSCVFAGNEVTGDKWHGGAVFNGSNGTLSINFSHFGTTPLPLPAPFNTLTDPNKTNGANSIGGAVHNLGQMSILSSSFIGNTSANNGGAIGTASNSDNVSISNCSISQNSATGQGGGVFVLRDDALVTFTNDTIANNTAVNGGGIFNAGDGDNAGIDNDEVLLKNTIVANNNAPVGANCGGGLASSESINSIAFPAAATCANAPAGNGDPAIGLAELTFAIPTIVTYALPIGASSAALGAGDADTCLGLPILNLDQRGFPRPQGGSPCDIGAYESSQANPTPTPTPSPTTSPSPSPTTSPSPSPSDEPTAEPTVSQSPTASPTVDPTVEPSASPTASESPTASPTTEPTVEPSESPTPDSSVEPSVSPTTSPSPSPSDEPTVEPSQSPTVSPTPDSSVEPSVSPSTSPSPSPTDSVDTSTPSPSPTGSETASPSPEPSNSPTDSPTASPTATVSPEPSQTPIVEQTPESSPTPSDTPSCVDQSVKGDLLSLDGSGNSQREVVKKAATALEKSTKSKAAKAFASKARIDADKLYTTNWQLTWSIPEVVSQCSNPSQNCVVTDFAATLDTYNKNAKTLSQLVTQLVDFGKNKFVSRSVANRLKARAKVRLQSALNASAGLPTSSTKCLQ